LTTPLYTLSLHDALPISSSYAFSWTGSTNRYGVGGITAYRNVDNDNPVDVQGTWGSGNASPTSFPAPSVTTTVANEMIVTAYGRSEEHTSELQSPYDLVC